MKGIISSGDKLTSNAGAQILKNGGNAFDAVCTAMLVAPLSEPMLTSLGGGGFLMSHQPQIGTQLYDFFVDVPSNNTHKKDFFPIEVDFGNTIQEFHIGAASVAVPGVLKGIYEIHRQKGKLPFSDIIQPAINHAKNGIYLSKLQAYFAKLLKPILISTQESKNIYTLNGNLITHNDLFKNPQYAQFLEIFAKQGDEVFYKGEIADSIHNLSAQKGGNLSKEELSSYTMKQREPIKFGFKGYEIATNTPPSAGGILIAFILKLLESRHLGEFGSINHLQELIEAMVTTSDFRHEHINEFLHKERLENILEDQPLMKKFTQANQKRVNLWGNTTHISVLDSDGNAASVTTTNGEGSGIIVPNCGIMLNNMLGEEDLNPHGFFAWPSGVRLPSMMAPTIVLKEGMPQMVLGSAGSNRIRSAITQAVLNYTVFGHSIEEVCEEKRLHFEKGELFFEPGFDQKLIQKVQQHYPVTQFHEKSIFFGGVNAVTNEFKGGADPRRGGAVVVVD